jgi:hypothetical protein
MLGFPDLFHRGSPAQKTPFFKIKSSEIFINKQLIHVNRKKLSALIESSLLLTFVMGVPSFFFSRCR